MTSARARFLPHAVVATLAAALYLPTLGFGFVFDDMYLVVNNPFLREPWAFIVAFARHFWYGTQFEAGYYRPIVVASFALNGSILGWHAAGFHLMNLLLHAANAVLVLVLARRLGVPERASWIAAAFFALHPVAAWPVASVVARVDLLPAFFVLLAWCCHASPRPGGRSALLTGLFFLAALACKESAIAFLAVPLLTWVRPPLGRVDGSGSQRARRLGACLLALGLYGVMRRAAGVPFRLGRNLIDPLINPLAHVPFPGRLYAALRLSGRYLLYLFVPARFSDGVDYNPGSAIRLGPWQPGVLFGLAAISLIGLAIFQLWRRRRRVAVPLAFGLLSFLPASNLLMPIGSLYAQNFLYMPLLGLTLALGMVFGEPLEQALTSRPAPTKALATILLSLLAWFSFREAAIWRDGVTLFSAWTERFPSYSLAHSGLGVAYLDQGDPVSAMAPLNRALDLNERNAEAHYNLGVALIKTSQDGKTLEEALRHTQKAVAIDPTLVQGRVNASKLLLMLERPKEAEVEAREALRLVPGFTPAQINLAESLFRQNRYPEAAGLFKELAALFPSDPNILSPCIVSLIHSGDLIEARKEAMKARQALPNLAWFDFCLARIEAREGHRKEASNLLRQGLAKDPAVREWMTKVTEFRNESI